MKRDYHSAGTEPAPPCLTMPIKSRPPRVWHRLQAIVKIILTVPLVMALLGAEVELRLAPQLDVIMTTAGVCTMWAWLGNRSGTDV